MCKLTNHTENLIISSPLPLCQSDRYTKGTDDDVTEARALLSRWQPQGESEPNSPATPSPAESPATPSSASGPDLPTGAVIRRRSGRTKPRPFSDYAQLVSRKFSIPEEEGAEPSVSQAETAATGTAAGPSHVNSGAVADGDSPGSCHGTSPQNHHRMRPLSAMEGMELFPSPGTEDREDLDCLPSVREWKGRVLM